jgi:hypothetical protein
MQDVSGLEFVHACDDLFEVFERCGEVKGAEMQLFLEVSVA